MAASSSPSFHAFQREAVARESVGWFFSDKLFQNFAARLLSLGHRLECAYYSGLERCAPSAHDFDLTRSLLPQNAKEKQNEREEFNGAGGRDRNWSPGKPVRRLASEIVEIVLPNDANVLGNMLGGRVMHLIDIAGALAANRHSNSHVVTASVDYLDFRFPIRVGEFIVLKSSVNRVFHTSMEVGVKVFAENILTGERKHTSSAYVTFVALDVNRQPHAAPPLILETEEERRRFREAGERRRVRLANAAQVAVCG